LHFLFYDAEMHKPLDSTLWEIFFLLEPLEVCVDSQMAMEIFVKPQVH